MHSMVVQCQHYTTSLFSRLESTSVWWVDICSCLEQVRGMATPMSLNYYCLVFVGHHWHCQEIHGGVDDSLCPPWVFTMYDLGVLA